MEINVIFSAGHLFYGKVKLCGRVLLSPRIDWVLFVSLAGARKKFYITEKP